MNGLNRAGAVLAVLVLAGCQHQGVRPDAQTLRAYHETVEFVAEAERFYDDCEPLLERMSEAFAALVKRLDAGQTDAFVREVVGVTEASVEFQELCDAWMTKIYDRGVELGEKNGDITTVLRHEPVALQRFREVWEREKAYMAKRREVASQGVKVMKALVDGGQGE